MNPGPEYYEYPALTTELLNLDRQTVFHIYIIIRSTTNVNFKLCTFCEKPLNHNKVVHTQRKWWSLTMTPHIGWLGVKSILTTLVVLYLAIVVIGCLVFVIIQVMLATCEIALNQVLSQRK